MATKYYGIRDNWTDDDVANVIEVASEDGSVSSVKVNGVEYGEGGGATLLATQDFEVNTTSTTKITVGTIQAGSEAYTSNKILYVAIRDLAGPRTDHFLGTDCWMCNSYHANGSTNKFNVVPVSGYCVDTNDKYSAIASQFGVYAASVSNTGEVTIEAKYNSTSSRTIDGTFRCKVYLLEWPDNLNPFIS